MALGILCQQFPRSIQMGVFPNAGKNIQHFASVWLRVLRAIGSEERQTICAREINQFAIDLLLPTNEMPLDFNKDIFASTDIDQKSRAIRRFVGRLTRSLLLGRFLNLPVNIARLPAAPFCETLVMVSV